MCYVLDPEVVPNGSANPPFFMYTYLNETYGLKVVRIDKHKVNGNNVEKQCQALNVNYHALTLDTGLEIQVSLIWLK